MKKYIQKPKIVVSEELKNKLDKLKLCKGDTYEDVILRLIENGKKR
jgi:predicted CopG family antitoxin